MKERKRQILVSAVIAAAGLALLLVAESRTCSRFLKSHVPMPGLWDLGFIVLGWQLLIAPPVLLAAAIARRSSAKLTRITGGVLSLLSIITLVGINAFFTWVMVSWGMATDWTFTK